MTTRRALLTSVAAGRLALAGCATSDGGVLYAIAEVEEETYALVALE